MVSYPENPENGPDSPVSASDINDILTTLLGPANLKIMKHSSMPRSFSPGDVVVLRSGGQSMTVEEANTARVGCVWMVGGNLVRNSFYPASLKQHEQKSM